MKATCVKMNRLNCLVIALLLGFFAQSAQSQSPPTPARGVNGIVHAVAIDASGNVYVGGSFSVAGTVYAENIAMYKPSTHTWSALQEGQGTAGVSGQGNVVNAIVIDPSGRVYVAGNFNEAGTHIVGNIAAWNPSTQTWSTMGGGVYTSQQPNPTAVNALYLTGGSLYVGGSFSSAGGVSANWIAIWNGSSWSAVGNPGTTVNAITSWRGNIYVGLANYYGVDEWSGSAWTPVGPPDLGSATGGSVHVLFSDATSGNLFAGGYALGSIGSCANQQAELVQWNGTSWSGGPGYLGCGDQVNAMCQFGDFTVVGGQLGFEIPSGSTAYSVRNVLQYVTIPFSQNCKFMGPGAANGVTGADGLGVYAIASVSNRYVFVGGDFSIAGNGECTGYVAEWDANANTWSYLGANQAPVVSITSPSSGAVSTASTVTISASASDDCTVTSVAFYDGTSTLGSPLTTPPYSYSWSGFSAGTHTLTAVATDNDGATTTSSPVVVTAMNSPTITGQPQSHIVAAAQTVTFSVTAVGTAPLSYQWYQGSTELSGATSSTLTLGNVADASAGSYTVTVNNSAGSATSTPATLTVVDSPQPGSETVNAGQTATFSVTVTGTGPLTYQWYHGSTELSDVTASSLVLANVTDANAGSYKVVVNNSAGSATSSSATLTVIDSPTITAQPASESVSAGGTATLSVTVAGAAPLSYQWYQGSTALTGATTSSLVLANVTQANAGSYTVTVNNAEGSVTSSAATLIVYGLIPGSEPLIDVDFGAGTSTSEVGFAAAGQTASDYWNFYTRDDGQGGYLQFGSLAPLLYADTSDSGAGLTIANAAGCWGTGASDTMYDSYLYPVDSDSGPNITVTITNLPPGQYAFYIYGHGEDTTQDTSFDLVNTTAGSATVDYGSLATAYSADYASPFWLQGLQYVLYPDVLISSTNDIVTITASPLDSPYAVIAGMQIVRIKGSTPQIDVDFGSGTSTSEVGFAATGETARDYWNFYTRDDGQGGYLQFGSLSPLLYTDTAVSGAGLTIANAAGAFGNGAADYMYDGYLYPLPPVGNIVVTLTNLPPGQYAFYIYGHGGADNQDSSYDLVNNTYASGTVDYGGLSTAYSSDYASPVWQQGLQYVLFPDVYVSSTNDVITVTVSALDSEFAIIAGMQIVQIKGAAPLIDVDFGAGAATSEVGFAATGETSNDYWNFYTRDDGQGGYLQFGSLAPLLYADTSDSGAGLTIANAAGCWGTGASDTMYDSYLYPVDSDSGPNITVTITNLPPGQYAFYIYGHGADTNQDSSFDLVNSTFGSGPVDYGSLSTLPSADYASSVWQQGLQYVLFPNVTVTSANDVITITVSPLDSPFAVIAGMQILKTE